MEDNFKEQFITIQIPERGKLEVMVADYVTAKKGDLVAFGYTDLTEEDVLKSVHRIVNGEKLVDIIDHFIKDDIVLGDDEDEEE